MRLQVCPRQYMSCGQLERLSYYKFNPAASQSYNLLLIKIRSFFVILRTSMQCGKSYMLLVDQQQPLIGHFALWFLVYALLQCMWPAEGSLLNSEFACEAGSCLIQKKHTHFALVSLNAYISIRIVTIYNIQRTPASIKLLKKYCNSELVNQNILLSACQVTRCHKLIRPHSAT